MCKALQGDEDPNFRLKSAAPNFMRGGRFSQIESTICRLSISSLACAELDVPWSACKSANFGMAGYGESGSIVG